MRVIALASLLVPFVASAGVPVTVKVIDLAGDTAFVQPGHAAGLAPGGKVKVGDRELVVVETTETTAALRIEPGTLAIGDTGTADVTPGVPAGVARPAPAPLAAYTEQWPAAVPPATTQHVTAVPLGAASSGGGPQLAFYAHAYGAVDQTSTSAQLEGRVVGSFAILEDRPLGADLDVAGRLFSDGYNQAERTPLFVRAAQLRYGTAADPALVIGRLRYAATSVGMLDGGRVATHAGDFELAAFGGLVPDPVSGKPDTSASRFGVEAIYERAASPWQPRVAVVAHGSTWEGRIDEERLSVDASAKHGDTWLDGWAEAQAFSADNPFGAPAVDLTGAGASVAWRGQGAHLGADVTFLRPERSLRLAAVLPDDWLCARVPKPGDVLEACHGGDFWLATSASAGVRGTHWALDAIGSVGETQGVTKTVDASGYLRGELRSGPWKPFVALSAGQASFADFEAVELGVGVSPSRGVDVSLSYRPERLDYVAAQGSYVLQSVVADLYLAVTPRLDVAVSAVGTTGEGQDVLAMLMTIAWRPLR